MTKWGYYLQTLPQFCHKKSFEDSHLYTSNVMYHQFNLLLFCEVVMSITLVFEEYITIPLCLHQISKFIRAFCRLAWIASFEVLTSNSVVSSAYMSVETSSVYKGRSFINIKNKRGPSIEPWGTPYKIDLWSDKTSFTDTRWVRFCKYDENQFKESSLRL